MAEILGQVVAGDFNKVVVRKKSSSDIEIGELMVAQSANSKILLQTFDLSYSSQFNPQTLELMSGMKLEEDNDLELKDENIRNYILAHLKPLLTITDNVASQCKNLPYFFTFVRKLEESDLEFIEKPKNPLFIGNLRSGSKSLSTKIMLDGEKVFSHHILIPAQTGRGKSNLASCMLWSVLDKDYCGVLVLDPHDEYYGRNKLGLKDHPSGNSVYYTTKQPPAGAFSLKINVQSIKPNHFNGVYNWSDPQKEALSAYYKKYKKDWIRAILNDEPIDGFHEGTIAVLKRRMISILDLQVSNGEILASGPFDFNAGLSTINDICEELEKSKTVIIDTSTFSGNSEILIGSLVTTEVFRRYKNYKLEGLLSQKPVVSVVIEEAPRVLGKEVLENGPNIFSTIAREGRKFKVGLVAITQLPSLIPRQILANMSTKIILGIEMAPERTAIIESSAQDLSKDDRTIASLDKGEAIVTSTFSKFAVPVKIPLFNDLVSSKKSDDFTRNFPGLH